MYDFKVHIITAIIGDRKSKRGLRQLMGLGAYVAVHSFSQLVKMLGLSSLNKLRICFPFPC